MPVLDLPLEKLRAYEGRNPRPADFDAYWAEALAELDATDPRPELVPNTKLGSRHSDCFDLWFTGVGGARIHAKLVLPKSPGPHPALLQFHGYTGHSGEWREKLAWSGEGFVVAAMDCRGQGGLSEDNGSVQGNTVHGHILRGLGDPDPRKLIFRQIFLDTAQLARVVMALPQVDPGRVGSYGGSQGGALSLVCAALEPRVRRVSSIHPFLSDYRRVWEMDLAKGAYDDLARWFRHFDPTHEREEWVFERLGYIDIRHLAPRIRAEVLMFVTLLDPICPPSTQFAAYNAIRSPKQMALYPDFAHEGLPGEQDRTFAFMRAL